MRGNITRRGKSSWRLKYDAGRDPLTGERRIRYLTVRGKRQDAERELTKLLSAVHEGTDIEPTKVTIRAYLTAWLDADTGLSGKTKERYRQLAEQQIFPHLGDRVMQMLKPAEVQNWHGILSQSGGKGGKPLAPQTVTHAHRVLHRALERASKAEIVSRNVASSVPPPKVPDEEIEIIAPIQLAGIATSLADVWPLRTIAATLLGTGMRRGELCALAWRDIDLDTAMVTIDKSVEETKAGLRIKATKTRHGRRRISLPPSTVEELRTYRRRELEQRLALGLGRMAPADLVFHQAGELLSPDNLSRDWRRDVMTYRLPPVRLHALRHTHASILIDAGLDILSISRRLGHASPTTTLRVYGHLFRDKNAASAAAFEAALQAGREG
jgi:integrase